MNKIIFLIAFFSCPFVSISLAQTTIEKYCFLKCTGPLGKNNIRIEALYGQEDSFFSFKDSSTVRRLTAVSSYHNLVDAFNYMGSLGWRLAIPPFAAPNSANSVSAIFCFRREFRPEELSEPVANRQN